MICQHCQHTFLRNYNFCPLCGKPMGEKRCLYCGRSTLLSARFCPGCGRPMDEPLFSRRGRRIIGMDPQGRRVDEGGRVQPCAQPLDGENMAGWQPFAGEALFPALFEAGWKSRSWRSLETEGRVLSGPGREILALVLEKAPRGPLSPEAQSLYNRCLPFLKSLCLRLEAEEKRLQSPDGFACSQPVEDTTHGLWALEMWDAAEFTTYAMVYRPAEETLYLRGIEYITAPCAGPLGDFAQAPGINFAEKGETRGVEDPAAAARAERFCVSWAQSAIRRMEVLEEMLSACRDKEALLIPKAPPLEPAPALLKSARALMERLQLPSGAEEALWAAAREKPLWSRSWLGALCNALAEAGLAGYTAGGDTSAQTEAQLNRVAAALGLPHTYAWESREQKGFLALEELAEHACPFAVAALDVGSEGVYWFLLEPEKAQSFLFALRKLLKAAELPWRGEIL